MIYGLCGIAHLMPQMGPASGDGSRPRSLADRLAEGPLPLAAALEYAADVAGILGRLHGNGLAHGNIAPAAIRVNERGAFLLPPNGLAPGASPRGDVAAFGAMLREITIGDGGTGDHIRQAASHLAAGCLVNGDSVPDLRRLAIHLRALRVLARFPEERPAPARRAGPRPIPEIPAPAKPSAAPLPRESCPRCSGPVFPSSARSFFDRLLCVVRIRYVLHVRFLRCHRCYYRYLRVFGVRTGRER